MQNTTRTIADVLNIYYEGMSLAEIRRNLIQQDNNYISRISAYNWVDRFSNLAISEANIRIQWFEAMPVYILDIWDKHLSISSLIILNLELRLRQ